MQNALEGYLMIEVSRKIIRIPLTPMDISIRIALKETGAGKLLSGVSRFSMARSS